MEVEINTDPSNALYVEYLPPMIFGSKLRNSEQPWVCESTHIGYPIETPIACEGWILKNSDKALSLMLKG